jgi:hypothetical protein
MPKTLCSRVHTDGRGYVGQLKYADAVTAKRKFFIPAGDQVAVKMII